MEPPVAAALVAGDPAGWARDAAESLRLYRQVGDRLQVGQMLGNLGNYELAAGDLDAARRHLAESLDIFRALNDRHNAVIATFNLGLAEYLGGTLGAAEALFAESLDMARRTGMRAATAYALLGLALAGRGGRRRGCAGERTGRCGTGCGRDDADAARARRAQARRAGIEKHRHRPAAGAERAYRPPTPGQHPPQARPLLARRGRSLGGTHRAGVSLASSGHLPRRRETGPQAIARPRPARRGQE